METNINKINQARMFTGSLGINLESNNALIFLDLNEGKISCDDAMEIAREWICYGSDIPLTSYIIDCFVARCGYEGNVSICHDEGSVLWFEHECGSLFGIDCEDNTLFVYHHETEPTTVHGILVNQ